MAGQTVLVIDDSGMIRRMVADMLAGRFQVLEARDGLVGLEVARANQPDLILLDFVMPRLDGYDTLQALRQDPALQRIPVVMMSGQKAQVTERIPEPFVGFDFIEKPFQAEQLLGRIERALAQDEALDRILALESRLLEAWQGTIERAVTAPVQRQQAQIEALADRLNQLAAEVEKQSRGMAVVINELRQIRQVLTLKGRPATLTATPSVRVADSPLGPRPATAAPPVPPR